MNLYITEKPSVAQALFDVMGGTKYKTHFEVSDGIIVAAAGHLFEPYMPENYDENLKKWSEATLPIIPNKWQLKVSESKTFYLNNIKKFYDQADTIVNVGDTDREGQLLIQEILDYFNNKKPVLRYWSSSIDEHSVKKALDNLESDDKYKSMGFAALARQRADWLFGINGTRAYTIAAQKAGRQGVYNVGRVKTPLLATIVRHERKIANFKSVDYYNLKINLRHSNGDFWATWRPKEKQDGLKDGLMLNKSIIDHLAKDIKASVDAIVSSYATKEIQELQPSLYDLAKLQVEAGKKWNYKPDQTLKIAQSLYDNKYTTYPRTDSTFLPENQLQNAEEILNSLSNSDDYQYRRWLKKINKDIKSLCWNDEKVSAHHAIIPTRTICETEKLKEEEKNIYSLIVQSYIAQFYLPHVYDKTTIEVTVKDELFTISGTTEKSPGWKELFRVKSTLEIEDEEKTEAEPDLPIVKQNDVLKIISANVGKQVTKPPKRFKNAELVDLMRNIHKHLKDPALVKQLKKVEGIGSPSTRDTFVTELLNSGFLVEEKRYIIPTEKAYTLIDNLPDEVTYPDQTALWEERFAEIEVGEYTVDEFLKEQSAFISDLCKKASETKIEAEEGIICPKCGGRVLRRKSQAGDFYWSCWDREGQNCKTSYPDINGKPDFTPPKEVPCACGGVLRRKKGGKGYFWGCMNYPNCKITFDDYKNKPDKEGKKKAATSKKKEGAKK